MRSATYVAMVVVLSGLSMAAGGCLLAAAGAGAGGAAYVIGDTEEIVSAPTEKVADAAVEALEALKLTLVSKTASALEGKVVGRTSDDKKISIIMKREGDDSTNVSVRVGTFGDETRNRQILDEIKKRL